MAAATRPPGLRAVILCATFVRNPSRLRLKFLRHLASPLVFRFYPMMTGVKAKLAGYSTPEWRLKTESLLTSGPP